MNDYTETYVRPIWKSIALYLLVLLCCNIVTTTICFVLTGWLSGDWNSIAKNTVFGDIYNWLVISIAFTTISPICCIPLYFAYIPHKYDKEWKQGLIPYNIETTIPMWYPEKLNGYEPVWKQNKPFDAVLKFVGIKNYNRYSFAILEDTAGIQYIMFSTRFNELAKEADVMHNTYSGTFIFDTNWKISNIRKA